MRRVVIADAGPLIALARLDQLDLLPNLFEDISVTAEVASEVMEGGTFPDHPVLETALAQPWMHIVQLTDVQLAACAEWVHLHQIDIGEASALVLAQHQIDRGDAALLIVDEFRGRSAAQHAKIPVTGTAGVLLLAKAAGKLAAVRPLLQQLKLQGYFLSDRLIAAAVRRAGEA